jgi:hypothetical protein
MAPLQKGRSVCDCVELVFGWRARENAGWALTKHGYEEESYEEEGGEKEFGRRTGLLARFQACSGDEGWSQGEL